MSRLRTRKQHKTDSKNAETEKRGINTSGLAVFPDELLLEIVSHLPSLPAPPSEKHDCKDAMAYVQQRDVLLALSRSCQHLRRFFRPYVWRRLEVTSGMRVGETILGPRGRRKGETAYAMELVRQLEIVTIRDPSLANYVQIVNFEITSFSISSVLVELGRCFSLFPNLHTVKLDMPNLYRPHDMTINGFKKHIYPSIRRVILAPRAYPLLLSCPNVQSVQCINFIPDLLKYLRNSPYIDSVGCRFRLTELKDAAIALPNIRQLRIYCHIFYEPWQPFLNVEEILGSLVLMQQLQVVILEMEGTCYPQIKETIIREVHRHLKTLYKRDGGKKQIQVLDVSNFSRDPQSQTITIPVDTRASS